MINLVIVRRFKGQWEAKCGVITNIGDSDQEAIDGVLTEFRRRIKDIPEHLKKAKLEEWHELSHSLCREWMPPALAPLEPGVDIKPAASLSLRTLQVEDQTYDFIVVKILET